MCPQKRHRFFFLLNKIKCLRWWVSNSHLSKSTSGFKVLFFSIIFKKKFPVFAFLYFTLIETPPTFESAELLQTILDWIRLLLIIVKKLMNQLNLKQVFEKDRKKEKDWGEKWGLLQAAGRKTIMVFFTFLRPNARRKREEKKKRNFRTIRIGCLQSFFFF